MISLGKIGKSLEQTLSSEGTKLCFGIIKWKDSGDKEVTGLGVWLGSLGCWPGSGYKLSTATELRESAG